MKLHDGIIRGYFFVQALGRIRQANPLHIVVRGVGFILTVMRHDIKCDVQFDLTKPPWEQGKIPHLEVDGIWFLIPPAPEDAQVSRESVKAGALVGVFKDGSGLGNIDHVLKLPNRVVGAARIGTEILDFLGPIHSVVDNAEEWLRRREESLTIEPEQAAACRRAFGSIGVVLKASEPIGVWRCREDHPLLK